MAISTLFVTTASTETLNGTSAGVICFRGGDKSYTQSRTVYEKETRHEMSIRKERRNPHMTYLTVS